MIAVWIISLIVTLASLGAAAWHRRRWLARHAAAKKCAAPKIASISNITGELIATGSELGADTGDSATPGFDANADGTRGYFG